MNRRRIWFHCSEVDHGATLTIERRPPKHRLKAEPETPRLCVCPSVPECFGARLFFPGNGVHVYSTLKQRSGIKPIGVWDCDYTREHWLIPPVTLSKVGFIKPYAVHRITQATFLFHDATKRGATAFTRIASILRAFEVLGDTFASVNAGSRRRLLQRAAQPWMSDPEDYLLNEAIELLEKFRTEV